MKIHLIDDTTLDAVVQIITKQGRIERIPIFEPDPDQNTEYFLDHHVEDDFLDSYEGVSHG
jgi:hypothetical protein|tara:strand:- start:867 stop:1049 length:183 start_codon:yes stop_codon:yes gene_type:complete